MLFSIKFFSLGLIGALPAKMLILHKFWISQSILETSGWDQKFDKIHRHITVTILAQTT